MFKKKMVLVFAILFLSLQTVFAIDLVVSSSVVKDTVINDDGSFALFDLRVTNNGNSGNFEINTFEKFDIEPRNFSLNAGETKLIQLKFFPIESMKENIGYVKVNYFIRETGGSEKQEGDVVIQLVSFDEIFQVQGENIIPDSDSIKVSLYNVESLYYTDVDVIFSAPFFDDSQIKVDLKPFEKKDFRIKLDQNRLKKLVFGTYTISATYTVNGRTSETKGFIKILEKSGLSVEEISKGLIIRKTIVTKTNEGNIPTVAEVMKRKNIISSLFTTFSPEPDRVKRQGLIIEYEWQKELQPADSLEVVVKTNWLYPLLLVIAVVLIVYLFNLYISTYVVLKKKVNFVKTKGGEFALRVRLSVKAKKFVEKVRIYDVLPAMSNLYEKFGTHPDKFNKQSGRLEWNISHLTEGEERVFNYIVYSKLKVIGRFELPKATAIFERDGQVHKAKSNQAFFINEARENFDED